MRVTLLICVSALGACARASAPPPASDSVSAPPASLASAATEPAAAATSSAQAAPSQGVPSASSSAAPAASTPAPTPSSQPAVEDCSRFETSPEYRDLPAEQRARQLATCQAKEEFRAFVAARQSCSSASQCTIVVGSCPFGCFVPVAKASASEVVAKLDALGTRLDKAGNRCVYRCMSPPAEACVAGRCSAGSH